MWAPPAAVAAGAGPLLLRYFCASSSSSSSPPPRPAPESGDKEKASADEAKKAGPTAAGTSAAPGEGPKAAAKEEGAGEAAGAKEEGARSKAEGSKGEKPGSKEQEAGKEGKKPPGEEQQTPFNMTTAAAGAVFALALSNYLSSGETLKEITIQELCRDYVPRGAVELIQIVNRSFCRVQLRKDWDDSASAPRTVVIQLGTPEAFEAKLEQAQLMNGIPRAEHIPIQYLNEANWTSFFLSHGISLILMGSLMFALRGMMNGNPMGGFPGRGGLGGPMGGGGKGGRNLFNMGKAFADGSKTVKSEIKFKDVAGHEQAKKEVMEFVDFLKDSSKYAKLGARIPKGGLLVGPPGTGKTLLAKAVAGEADCPFYAMSGSDFVELYGGVGAARVRDLFKTARESAPSIIFIDEIDAIGRKRSSGGSTGGSDERESTLNQMLVEMDGFEPSTGVVVLAGTNRSDILDQALLRPGRFDRQIAVDKPDLAERKAIFLVHLKPITLHEELAPEEVARRMATLTPGFAGADIANICNEAAIVAARREGAAVEMNDFERATERVMAGLPKTGTQALMGESQRRTVALHESGHAVAGWFLQHADPLLKVSIVPRSSGALGFAQYLPQEMSLHSREAILDKIAVSLGGRAAEELFVGKISTGASDDLDKVTKMAYSMISVYGMNPEVGLLSYRQGNDTQFYKPYSEATGRLMDREARQIVDEEYKRVKDLLLEKRDIVEALSAALLKKETLVFSDLTAIMGERPFGVEEHYKQYLAGANPFTSAVEGDGAAEAEDAAQGAAPSAGAEATAPPVAACRGSRDGEAAAPRRTSDAGAQ